MNPSRLCLWAGLALWLLSAPAFTQAATFSYGEADMNTWSRIHPGSSQKIPAGQWGLYRTSFNSWKGIQTNGGIILLPQICGRAAVFLNGKIGLLGFPKINSTTAESK